MLPENSDNLLAFVSDLSGVNYRRVEEDLGEGFVRLGIAEAERRQAKHDIRGVEDIVAELIRNSRDAGANRIFVAFYKKNATKRHIVVIDDGCGIPEGMHECVFEPRVTSKLDSVLFDDFGIHGRGMALYSIKAVTEVGRIVSSQPGCGSVIEVVVDTSKLSERRDQSCFPAMQVKKGEVVLVKGPHNVPRLLVEFSLKYPRIELFFGSPAQIIATMFSLHSQADKTIIQGQDNAVCGQLFDKKVYEDVAAARDAASLLRIAANNYGLDISERTGWRIITGEVRPLSTIIPRADEDPDLEPSNANTLNQEASPTKHIPQEELEDLSKAVRENIREIERKYFVKIQGEPKVWKSRSQINITFRLERDDL